MPIAIPICATIFGISWVVGDIIEAVIHECYGDSYNKELDVEKEKAIAKQMECKLEMKRLDMTK